MKKRIFSFLLIFIILSLTAAGCTVEETRDEKPKIVCVSFPQYNWTLNILGERSENIQLILLNGTGADLHSYQASAADMIELSSCDLLIYGGISDSWAAEALKNSGNSRLRSISMTELLSDSLLCSVDENEHGHGAEHEHEPDEHVWLSLKNAEAICTAIKEALIEIDPEGKSVYEANCGEYRQQLAVLSADYESTVNSSAIKTVLLADRFPFRYLFADYGISCFAAFPGCSAETEASFETVSSLAAKADELSLAVILVTESSDKSVANTVKNSTQSKNQTILEMNSMQSLTKEQLASKTAYIDIMRENLEILKTALG